MKQQESILKALGIMGPEEKVYRRIWATETVEISDHVGLRIAQEEENGFMQLEIVVDL